MSNTVKYILYAVGVLAILLALGLFSVFNAPKASVKEKSAEFTLTANELFQEYSENQTVADQKFIDRVIEVSGTIFEISEDQQGATVLILSTGDNGSGVLCTMELSEIENVKGKKIGDTITLKGVCTGMLMEVVLNRCRVVSN